MRVVSGRAGGRRLRGPTTTSVRPTTDKVRGAIFNALESMGGVEGLCVLDLFAGTGACGIEALSRGAASVTFVDNDRRSLSVVAENLHSLDLEGELVQADAVAFLERGARFDLVIADPPYRLDVWVELQDSVREKAHAELLVCESSDAITVASGWETVRERRYGDTTVTILRRGS